MCIQDSLDSLLKEYCKAVSPHLENHAFPFYLFSHLSLLYIVAHGIQSLFFDC